MKRRRKYSDEFKAEAVAMVIEHDRSINDVSESLSVGATALRRWVQVSLTCKDGSTMAGKSVLSAEKVQIQMLEKQVKQLQKERDLLKKSIAFFARDIDL